MIGDPLANLPDHVLRRISAAFMERFAARPVGLDLRPAEAAVLLVVAASSGAWCDTERARPLARDHEREADLLACIPESDRSAFIRVRGMLAHCIDA